MMKVKKNTLLLLACLVWIIAGFNIVRIGFLAYSAYLSIFNILLSGIIFSPLVKKHTKRILGYPENYKFFWNFFDLKAFIIMAVMITGGIVLRVSGLAPEHFIAVFYSGLGMSLLLAGILFGRNYVHVIRFGTTE